MPRFLIEVPHAAERVSCARAVEVFLASGSHFLTQADWGCMDGVHSAWIIVEVDGKADALAIVPPAFRSDARVVGLNQFSMAEIGPILGRHREPGGGQVPLSG